MKDFFCPNCGTKLKAGTKFCPNCGHNVERFTKNSNDSNQDTDYIQGARRESSRTVKSFTQKWGSNKKRNNIFGIRLRGTACSGTAIQSVYYIPVVYGR